MSETSSRRDRDASYDIAPPASLPFTAGDVAGVGGLLGEVEEFFDLLQPASWRGIEFNVLGSRVRAGRRKALHEYPFRDGVWVEDMGKRGRVYGFAGFLIGDDVGTQIKALTEAMEKAGAATLVHPTFGSRQCESLEFEGEESWEEGRVWRFRAEFLDPVPRGFQLQPMTQRDTVAGVNGAADGAAAATEGSFLDKVKGGLGSAFNAAKDAVAVVRPYVATGLRLVGDASRMANLASSLSGRFGRYAGGHGISRGGLTGAIQTVRQTQSAVQSALGAASQARALVTRTGGALSALVGL